jgi:hypothetical protein
MKAKIPVGPSLAFENGWDPNEMSTGKFLSFLYLINSLKT